MIYEYDEMKSLRDEIETLRSEMNAFIEYPDIFKNEIIEHTEKLENLINRYSILSISK